MKVKVSDQNNIKVNVKKKPTIFVNQSGVVTRSLDELADVDISAKKDGSLLIYDENQEKFVASTLLDKQQVNGGFF